MTINSNHVIYLLIQWLAIEIWLQGSPGRYPNSSDPAHNNTVPVIGGECDWSEQMDWNVSKIYSQSTWKLSEWGYCHVQYVLIKVDGVCMYVKGCPYRYFKLMVT